MQQLHDVIPALAQRRQRDGNYVQPEEQVFAEQSVFDSLREIMIGRCNDANIDTNCLVAADPLNFSCLECAQQFCLRLHAQVADLVEKQRTCICEFKLANPAFCGAGERPLLMAEHFAFHKITWYRGAVDTHKWFFMAWTVLVNGDRHELLARTGFSRDEHACVTVGPAIRQRSHADHRITRADHFTGSAEFGAQNSAEPVKWSARVMR